MGRLMVRYQGNKWVPLAIYLLYGRQFYLQWFQDHDVGR